MPVTSGSSFPSASSDREPRFPEGVQSILAFLAVCAEKSVESRAAEVFLTAFVDNGVNPDSSITSPKGLNPFAECGEVAPLAFAEVAILVFVHRIRCAVRNLKDQPPGLRVTVYPDVLQLMEDLYLRIPDPVFSALGLVMHSLREQYVSAQASSNPEEIRHCAASMVGIEAQMLEVVEAVQREVLQSTRNLSHRASTLTFQFRQTIPFV